DHLARHQWPDALLRLPGLGPGADPRPDQVLVLAVLHRVRRGPGRGLRAEGRRARLAAPAQPPGAARAAGAALVPGADRGRTVGPRPGRGGRRAAVLVVPVVRGDPRLLRHRAAVDSLAASAVGTHARAAAPGQSAAGAGRVVVDLA